MFCGTAVSQASEESISFSPDTTVEIHNPNGRISVTVVEDPENESVLRIQPSTENSIVVEKSRKGKLRITVDSKQARTDLEVFAPVGAKLRLYSNEGQITVSGPFLDVEAYTVTGTIYADTPASNLKYKFLWTASFPRVLSAEEISKIKEKSAGKHVIEGEFEQPPERQSSDDTESKKRSRLSKRNLFLSTARGIILLNVPPSQVPNNLLPKEMTSAARAIIRSGDSVLTEAIRRSAPDLFGEYASTLPPFKPQPVLTNSPREKSVNASLKRITVQVTDTSNRAFGGLQKADFEVTERGEQREIVGVEQSTAPFNLLLLLDVSGSVENYVDFIRKAARAFVQTVDPKDRVSIVVFNDDVKTLTTFTSDKNELSESLDTFDAGGGTALYDAIGFGLSESLRPLKGDRTAIVILSDGDDNRSFLPFEALLGSIQESGALVYPMYVPSSLIASDGKYSGSGSVDPLRDRYLSNNLSSKAEDEGAKLAEISGGSYYPISQTRELQAAYSDIVVQLRTAYTITYRSETGNSDDETRSSRIRVKVDRKNSLVRLGPVTAVSNN